MGEPLGITSAKLAFPVSLKISGNVGSFPKYVAPINSVGLKENRGGSTCVVDAALIHPGHTFKAVPSPHGTGDSSIDEEKKQPKAVDNHECRSCASLTKPLSGLHVAQKDPKYTGKFRDINTLWPLRISRLIEAAQRGCAFCTFCLDKFFGISNAMSFGYQPSKRWYAEPSKHDKEREDLIEHCMVTLTRLKKDTFDFVVSAVCDTKSGMELPDFARLRIGLSDKSRDKGKLYVEMDVSVSQDDPTSEIISTRPPNPFAGSDQAMSQTRKWMHECEQKHGSACSPTNYSGRLPRRVIDVSGGAELRLYEASENDEGRYAALSYCWGGPQEFKTTSSTLAERISGFSVGALPLGIQDAVRVTQNLGMRFLWVDSMCIIQDSEQDKAHQIARMSEIYQNAFVTICNARSDSVCKSFLEDWADPSTGQWPTLIPLAYPIPNEAANTLQKVIDMQPETWGTIWLLDEDRGLTTAFDDPISRRGWSLQERVLSPRLLSYGRWPTWQCSHGLWTDGGFFPQADKLGAEEGRLTDALLKLTGPDGIDHFRTNQLHKSWYKLLNHYTKREVSFEADRLPAIGGIAVEISRITGAKYLAGLWGNNLLYDIMWYADSREWLVRPERWRAPTWSWASINCPVAFGDDLPSSGITDDATPLARVLSCRVTPAIEGGGDFGRVASGELEIDGPFMEVSREDVLGLFQQQDLSPPPPKSNDVSEWYKQMLEHIANMPKGAVDEEDVEKTLPGKVFALMTFSRDWFRRYKDEERTDKTCYSGLLLREAEDGKFERIGAFLNEDAKWMDQSVKPWEKRTVVLL
ncbi:heterokaryon incompatibility protein 6 [Diplogelasinospora grovesii]|uniref:Heterokaryon incompatibility protein 6 n=1 Tax=Diplogelasinospora grovesii TaxID=303347 RepID=A0AAN6MVM2_9PEZI|nr:heterokaryon incompatibility protein 6 [Diplogelasinospora grovesii]